MPYFQNVFAADFEGALVLGDRQYAPTYRCSANAGRGGDIVTAWNPPKYDLTGTDADSNDRKNLTLAFAIDPQFVNWATITVDVSSTAAAASATLPEEIQAALVANANFSSWFTVTVTPGFKGGVSRLLIKQNQPVDKMRFYVVSGGAEEALGFNARAGISELPSYFARHTIDNRFTYPDSQGMLIQLAPTTGPNNYDANLVENAVDSKGVSLEYDPSVVSADWALLRGSSGLFQFTKNTLDSNSPPRITSSIVYSAGALEGDLAMETKYTYSSTNLTPTTVAEIPYVLTSGDLITP